MRTFQQLWRHTSLCRCSGFPCLSHLQTSQGHSCRSPAVGQTSESMIGSVSVFDGKTSWQSQANLQLIAIAVSLEHNRAIALVLCKPPLLDQISICASQLSAVHLHSVLLQWPAVNAQPSQSTHADFNMTVTIGPHQLCTCLLYSSQAHRTMRDMYKCMSQHMTENNE